MREEFASLRKLLFRLKNTSNKPRYVETLLLPILCGIAIALVAFLLWKKNFNIFPPQIANFPNSVTTNEKRTGTETELLPSPSPSPSPFEQHTIINAPQEPLVFIENDHLVLITPSGEEKVISAFQSRRQGAFDVSGDDAFVVYSNAENDTVFYKNIKEDLPPEIVSAAFAEKSPLSVYFVNDSKEIVIVNSNQIWKYTIAAKNLAQIYTKPVDAKFDFQNIVGERALSPDGNKIFIRKKQGDQISLAILELSTKKIHDLSLPPYSIEGGGYYESVPYRFLKWDSSNVYTLITENDPIAQKKEHYSTIFYQSTFPSTEKKKIFETDYGFSAYKNSHYLVLNKATAELINLNTGRSRPLWKSDDRMIDDGSLLARIVFSDDQQTIYLFITNNSSQDSTFDYSIFSVNLSQSPFKYKEIRLSSRVSVGDEHKFTY